MHYRITTTCKMLTVAFTLACVLSSGCSNPISSVQRDLDANPRLKQKGITTQVMQINNGYATIAVKGFGPDVTKALKDGMSLKEIEWGISTDIEVIQDAETAIKKNPAIKGVMWTAQ
jgi:hypothetical protein